MCNQNLHVLGWLRYIIIIVIIMGHFMACNSYFQKTRLAQEYFQKGRFNDAIQVVRNTDFYMKPRNEFLYHVEMGTLEFLSGSFQNAIDHFNAADYFEEDYNTRTNAIQDATIETLANPASSTYKGEYFERFMLHYYKILSYIALNDNESARVEARRLEIRLRQLHDLSEKKDKKYSDDAFMHIMQGIVYERMKEYNDAFIAYRAAYEIFTQQKDGISNNISLPRQLCLDLARVAKYAGFQNEYEEYVEQWHLQEEEIFPRSHYEALIFWENGIVPIKNQKEFIFAAVPFNGTTVLYNNKLDLIVPIPSSIDMKGLHLSDLGIIRVAFPTLVERPAIMQKAKLIVYDTIHHKAHSLEYNFSEITNIENLAKRSLNDRQKRDIAIAITRIMLGKITEITARQAATYAKEKGKNNTAILLGIVGLISQVASIAKEKADTRSWLTLPATISYTRIAIKKGDNLIKITFNGTENQRIEHQFTLHAEQEGIYLHSIRTPMSLPPDPLKYQPNSYKYQE